MATLISTPQELDAIRNDLTGNYELANDIDMSGFGNFTPFYSDDNNNYFNGTLDGKGYKIKNLSIVKDGAYTGLFGRTTQGTIKNLGLEDVYVESNNNMLGGLIGLNYFTIIDNCFVTGTIKQTNSSKNQIGGLVGRFYGEVTNSYTDCDVSGGSRLGGFVGYATNSDTLIKNNYTKSTVSGDSEVGGFIGAWNENSGYEPSFQSNYFDSDVASTTNYTTSGVYSKTTAEMQDESTYSSWNFTDVWLINNDYPKLQTFEPVEQPAKQESRDITSYINSINTSVATTINNYIPPKIEEISVNSNISNIQSSVQYHRATKRVGSSYINKLNTKATQSSQTVREGIATTYISPLNTNVNITTYKQAKLHNVNLMAYTKPILANIDVLIPIEDKTIYGITSIVSNRSDAYMNVNKTTTQVINNPSLSEVME